MKRAMLLLFELLTCVALAGCERTFRDMYDQPRYKPLAPSTLWPDGRSARPPVEGTVARAAGTFAGTSSGTVQSTRIGRSLAADAANAMPAAAPPDLAELRRGRERFDIFCSPCHSVAGDGDGMVVRRGFPRPPSFHSDRLRNAPDAHFYDVITHGYGAMYPYAERVPPTDRVAIIAYIRALQLAFDAPLSAVPQEQRARLEGAR